MGWLEDMKNQSFVGSYANASRMRGLLKDQDYLNKYEISPENAEAYDQALRSQQGQAIAGGIVTGLTGTTTLLSNAMKDAQIRDTSIQEGMISDLYDAGNFNYNNYDQLANDYARTNFNPQFNYQDIRGMSEGQQIGSVATSALSGAATGLQIGGPWGALIGGVVGLGTGLGGVLSGNDTAKTKLRSLQLQSDIAASTARQNFAAAHERIGDNIHRQNAVNAVARGGKIQTIKEYADKVLLHKPKMRSHNGFSNISRIKGEGGLTIRFKK